MAINIKAPKNVMLQPKIVVFGVGGAGGNAINNMIKSKLQGAIFVAANTDAQALEHSEADSKIQLGATLTQGLGAGASPELGMNAAEESAHEIRSYLESSNMVFITAGMGGGTGTGASPVVARLAKELDILTVGVVTKPFAFEGSNRMRTAEQGLLELQKYIDTLIVIPNQNLFRIANEKTTFADAFKMADDVLSSGVRGVTDLMVMPGLINLDYADIKSVMSSMGQAMMGTGEATGEDRAIKAAEAAITNPLIDNCSMQGAQGVLINITGGNDITLFEVDAAANKIRDEVNNPSANLIFGSTSDPNMEGSIRVSVVATGIDKPENIYRKSPANTQFPLPGTNNRVNSNIHSQTRVDISSRYNLASKDNITRSRIAGNNFNQNTSSIKNDINDINLKDNNKNDYNQNISMTNVPKDNNDDKIIKEQLKTRSEVDHDHKGDIYEIPVFLRNR